MANHITITGNICNDLEIKTSGETKILNFTVAVRRKYKDKEGNYESDFIRCVAFNNTANFIANYFKKGSPILVEGSLQTTTYETESGEKRNSFNVVVESTDFFGGKKEDNQSNNVPNAQNFEEIMKQTNVEFTTIENDNSLPF